MPEVINQPNAVPMVNEAATGKPWWRACLIGCGIFLVVISISGYLLIQYFFGQAVVPLTALPNNYPADLEPYKLNEASTIQYSSGKYRSRAMSVFTAPLSLVTNLGGNKDASSTQEAKAFQEAVGNFTAAMANQDSLNITWQDMKAERTEVMAYYSNLALAKKMTGKTYHDEATGTDLLAMQNEEATLQLYVQDIADTPLLDKVTLIVNYNVKK